MATTLLKNEASGLFVLPPRSPKFNNAAERSLRGPVVARKISGGTWSAAGSTTWMRLTSFAAIARLRGKDPTVVFEDLLRATPAPAHPL